jgi:hypothetical protein
MMKREAWRRQRRDRAPRRPAWARTTDHTPTHNARALAHRERARHIICELRLVIGYRRLTDESPFHFPGGTIQCHQLEVVHFSDVTWLEGG